MEKVALKMFTEDLSVFCPTATCFAHKILIVSNDWSDPLISEMSLD